MISKNIFNFLEALKSHNNREWFKSNISTFRTVESEVKNFYSHLYDELNQSDSIDNFKVFRIYRDVRFSKNKTPYKTNLGISFKRSSPNLRGGYYFHIKPNESFIACGFFSPNKEDLLRIRKELEIDSDEFRDILNNKSIKNHWGDIDGDPLKTSPRGFLKNSPNIDLIRMKRFIFFKKYSDDSFFSSNLVEKISSDFRIMRPFLDYMSMVLTTDLNGISVLEK